MTRIATIDMDVAQIEARALAIAADLDRKSGPYYADVGEGQGCWHIVRTAPGAENKATDHLAHRGIGVFDDRLAGMGAVSPMNNGF